MGKGKLLVLEGAKGYPGESCLRSISELISKNHPREEYLFLKEPYLSNNEDKKKFDEIIAFMRENPYKSGERCLKYFTENRKKHNDFISSKLNAGENIILDRYWHSNFAFQGTQGIPLEEIARLNEGLQFPDLTLIFENSQMNNRRYSKDNFSREGNWGLELSFMEKVEARYRSLGFILRRLIKDYSVKYIVADRGEECLREQMEPLIKRIL